MIMGFESAKNADHRYPKKAAPRSSPLLRGLRTPTLLILLRPSSVVRRCRPRERRGLTATIFLPVAALETTGLSRSRRESVARGPLEERGGRSWRRRNDNGTRATGNSRGRGRRDGWRCESGGLRSFELAAGGGAALSLGRGHEGSERGRDVLAGGGRVWRGTPGDAKRRSGKKALESTCKGGHPDTSSGAEGPDGARDEAHGEAK